MIESITSKIHVKIDIWTYNCNEPYMSVHEYSNIPLGTTHPTQPSFPLLTHRLSPVHTIQKLPSDFNTPLSEGTCAICFGKLAEAIANVKCFFILYFSLSRLINRLVPMS